MGCDSPLGLVVAAARGRQHPAARVAPPQTLMGCSPVVAAAQPVLYSNLTPPRSLIGRYSHVQTGPELRKQCGGQPLGEDVGVL
jgi:hypothetical protein